jgi:hypothetical protein
MNYLIVYLLFGIPFTALWNRFVMNRELPLWNKIANFFLVWAFYPFYVALFLNYLYRVYIASVKCVWCGTILEKNEKSIKAHWRDCEKHPSKKIIEKLRKENRLLRTKIGLIPLSEDDITDLVFRITQIGKDEIKTWKERIPVIKQSEFEGKK